MLMHMTVCTHVHSAYSRSQSVLSHFHFPPVQEFWSGDIKEAKGKAADKPIPNISRTQVIEAGATQRGGVGLV